MQFFYQSFSSFTGLVALEFFEEFVNLSGFPVPEKAPAKSICEKDAVVCSCSMCSRGSKGGYSFVEKHSKLCKVQGGLLDSSANLLPGSQQGDCSSQHKPASRQPANVLSAMEELIESAHFRNQGTCKSQ